MTQVDAGSLADLTAQLARSAEQVEALRRELEEVRASEVDARAELVRSAQLATLGHLVRGVAHEINTPLGALASSHDTTQRALSKLQRILDDEVVTPDELVEVRRIVVAVTAVEETSVMAVDRMKHVVSSLRNFGRPDRSEIDHIDLAEAIQGTLELLKHELGEGIEVVQDLGDIPLVECYAQQINQIFMNLMMNAAHAMGENGTLTIRTHKAEDAVEAQVSDTGHGISSEALEHLFEPGFTTKGKRVGMGLGLAICREIVDRHDGDISVTSEVGVGTTFTLRLPVSLPDAKKPEAALAQTQP